MKKLNFEIPLQRCNYIEDSSFNSIENFIESFSKGFLKISVALFSDTKKEDIVKTFEFEDIRHLTNFILYYVYNILLNNEAAKKRKRSPYDINLVQRISFSEKKFQLYIFLDDAVFGLVVGTRFKNILSLIQSIFPLIAKTEYLNEIRFFPVSREKYILEGKENI